MDSLAIALSALPYILSRFYFSYLARIASDSSRSQCPKSRVLLKDS
jgi:hypothetical protein